MMSVTALIQGAAQNQIWGRGLSGLTGIIRKITCFINIL